MHQSLTANLFLYRRRNLAGLIDIYESNYYRLLRLIPELDQMQGTTVSRVAGALDLYLTVLERSVYTTTLALTYEFDDPERPAAEPNVRIRIYHDAKVVEVLSIARRKRQRHACGWRVCRKSELDRKWEINRFLQKWLGFCHRQGHLFLNCTVCPVEPPVPAGAE